MTIELQLLKELVLGRIEIKTDSYNMSIGEPLVFHIKFSNNNTALQVADIRFNQIPPFHNQIPSQSPKISINSIISIIFY